jgi:hypothetical protein
VPHADDGHGFELLSLDDLEEMALAGRIEEGKIFAATIRQSQPNFRIAEFLSAFSFSPDAEALFRKGAKQIALD